MRVAMRAWWTVLCRYWENPPMNAGRYAPSPSGPLHLGNLRTALIAWALARQTGRSFFLRIDDIDPGRDGAADQQIRELERLGIDWDGPVYYQAKRRELYEEVLSDLQQRGLVFPCFCSRKDIREATRAPHMPPTHYPGTCLRLTDGERREAMLSGKTPALRLKPSVTQWSIDDDFVGRFTGPVDAFVLRRGDLWPAYNLASVVDDIDLGVDQVVRGNDLLSSSPAQAYLTSLISDHPMTYVHVPLVLGPGGQRLAKRDGAVTMEDCEDLGLSTKAVFTMLSASLNVPDCDTSKDFIRRFDLNKISAKPMRIIFEKTGIPYMNRA
ncbi:tRNA glutamyl-Q(34) synthetase GluQRS [Actinomycetaceae bacterium WB03_NA08]|uniref:tRNA glutamyl-Q(34) synthetase GluQRS n=2 Tax=Scrofimicrobium canadense TaxID=2652290 RepID=A0A6N7W483_9ACTO|nr:tRNA glutamyl-Q(34) synthetase GluQRS [Scrofimicrobium canadense]